MKDDLKSGYVYIMTNQGMPNLLKIGFTSRSPEERKRELSRATGVPVEFNIKYEVFSPNVNQLESRVHEELKKYRPNQKKEFFEIDLSHAIEIISKNAEEIRLSIRNQIIGINESLERYEALEILGEMKERYEGIIRDEIKSVRIYQTSLRCYLEITEEDVISSRETPLIDQKIHRMDLGFIIDDDFDNLTFKPGKAVSRNARVFIEEFNDYSKLVCCSELFTDKGAEIIQTEHFERKKPPPIE